MDKFCLSLFCYKGAGKTLLGLVAFVWLTDDNSFWNVRPTRTMDSVPTSVPISLYCGYNEITVVTAQCWAIKLVTTYTNRTKETLKKQNKKQTLFGYESAVPINLLIINLSNFYLLKVNNRNTTRRYEICSELTIKTPEWHHWCSSDAFIVNFEHISNLLLELLLLTLNICLMWCHNAT